MSNRPPRKPSPPAEPAIPVWSRDQLAEYMVTTRGLSHLIFKHDRGCPAIGTGRGCVCRPEQFLYDSSWRLLARVEG